MKMASSLYDWGISVPWSITSEALDAMLSIASREDIDPDSLAHIMHGPKSLALRDGRRRDDSERTQMLGGVARIVIDGPIYRYADYFTKYSGGVTTESLARDFQTALDDPAVAAIALIIDSPGGEATGINELADTIYAARGKKPIGAYIEGYGASAAYWIASAADIVTVDESALVGSIGTVMGVLDPGKRIKMTIDFVSTQSPKKRVDPTTEDGRMYLQSLVDDMTEVFIAKVMRNRSMTRAEVLAIEGGMRIGQHAVSAGLADSLGAEDRLIRDLAEQATRKSPYIAPPARVPSGAPMRMEESMQIFSKEWWGNLFAAQAELEPATLTAATLPRALERGEMLTSGDLPAGSTIASSAPIANPFADRLAELESQLGEQQAQARQASAASFADGAVRAHQAYPSERQALYDAYVQASEDDAARPLATARVAQIEALVTSRTPHSLTDELIATSTGGVLASAPDSGAISEERHQALLAMTPLGETVRRRRAKSA
jgi:ClpP class serine protease